MLVAHAVAGAFGGAQRGFLLLAPGVDVEGVLGVAGELTVLGFGLQAGAWLDVIVGRGCLHVDEGSELAVGVEFVVSKREDCAGQ